VELPFRTLPYWNVQQVRAALDQHEIGVLQASALLVDAMDRDDRVQGTISTRVAGVLGLPLIVKPANDSAKAIEIADIVRKRWNDWFPEGDVGQLLKWGIELGVGLGEGLWSLEDGLLCPRLKVWHPQWLWWRWDLNNWQGGWQLTTMDGLVEPRPGTGKWCVLQPGGARIPWMTGIVRSLARLYLIRGFAYRDWARWSEVHGGGIKRAYVPSQARPADKSAFFASLTNLGANGIVLLPQSKDDEKKSSFDLDLLEATGNESEGFDKLLSRVDAAIAILVLGQNLTTEVKGGSYAAASAHGDVKQDITEADESMLMHTLGRDFLRPFAAVNFGDPNLAPSVRYDTEPPANAQTRAETLLTYAKAASELKNAGSRADVDASLVSAGYPMKKSPKPRKVK
jgi:phage gp29-like protein